MESKKKEKGENALIKTYLVAYNVSQMLGWTILLIIGVSQFFMKGQNSVYKEVNALLKIVQTAAILEIVHCAVGFVRSNVLLTAIQVYSRVFVVWAVIHSVSIVQVNNGFLMLLLAWTVTEIIRYAFYFFSLLGKVPHFLVWLRYTLFIVLYPLGVTGELLVIWASLSYVEKTRMFSLDLPNQMNISFNFFYYLWFVMLMYIPLFPQLYLHMLTQRKKILGTARPKTE
ncbi:very-long-chain (3R)-3-hydroxyacyl-CoA dehydratase 2-like [Gigantopelta aegis]|uniref:very-long-chain (3R)-3-hydroxyacyl-CoA dehydratase 2-like n=1 Tax=Gigantopelta aegis TaxID=1735272 RepID=UPI001B88E031|nr:very-long-chain (3R)-3-hydroxyacyl-CoA dehydratase 2-like [Gigantopelta aegis]